MATLNPGIAISRNPNINIENISSAEIEKDSGKWPLIWSLTLDVPNTLKLHCLRAHNENPLRVLTVSPENDFTLVEIFQGPHSNQSEPEEQNLNEKKKQILEVDIGDWVLEITMSEDIFPER